MVKVQRQAKKGRPALKKGTVKTVPKSKRGAPKPKKAVRKSPAARSASKNHPDQAPITAMMNSKVPTAVVAAPEAKGQEFPLFWPALGLMRMWLGPRKTSQRSG